MATQKNNFPLESGIPITNAKKGMKKYNFPLLTMEVNQSFLVTKREVCTLRTYIKDLRSNDEGKWWVTRKISDDQFRVWRVS